MGRWVGWGYSQRRPELINRLPIPRGGGEQHPPVDVSLDICGLELNGGAEMFNRFGHAAGSGQRDRQVMVDFRKIGFHLQRGLKMLDGIPKTSG